MRAEKRRQFVGVRINCDCASYLDIRRPLKPSRFPRCRCGRTLGDMQYEVIWKGTATFHEAWNLTRQANQPQAKGT